jgi:excinuclease ABC subunit A
MLSRYRGKTACPECRGTRLRKDTNYVKIGGLNVSDIVQLQLNEALVFFTELSLSEYEASVASRLLLEIKTRLKFLIDVGLFYLTLNRLSSTLSGGESQRINLATSLGSSLIGSMYILDEPSIGLHPRDTERLIKILYRLRDIGNTVIVVEHDEEIIKASDQIIDIGPDAGEHGGELVFQGTYDELKNNNDSYTALYLTNRKKIELPERRRSWNNFIEIVGASQNNLKNITVKIPLNILLLITGVSGSGKSTLVKDILYPAVKRQIDGYGEKSSSAVHLSGHVNNISSIEYIDQNPIGRSSRSNPATYLKAFDDIRALFASQKLAKLRGYKPGNFSFNIPGGRCDECEGEGVIKVEMQFMADIYLKCDSCNGNRFKEEVLEIKYEGKSISDILSLTVNQAIKFFNSYRDTGNIAKRIIEKITPLSDVGLGYLHLGQPSNTLSGGEAQRVKLAYFLSKGVSESPTLFVFDEPSTGLHVHDIGKLLVSLNSLIEIGHSVIVIEHNTEIIKSADWIIDLGPDGGYNGGDIVFEGLPEDIIKCKESHTGKYLVDKISK